MSIDPSDIVTKVAVSTLTELFRDAIRGVHTLSKYLTKEAETKDLLGRAVRAYTTQLSGKFNQVRVLGMQSPIPLEQIYTKVRVLDRVRKSRPWTGESSVTDLYGTIRQGIDVVNNTHRAAILGRPGAGKTTFLRHILLMAIEGRLNKPVIPIFVILNDISTKENAMLSAIVAQFLVCELSETELFVKNLLRNGRCIVLLDGLDEVPTSNRQQVIREIASLTEEYNASKFVVSCRVAVYNYWFEKFSDFEIADFSETDVAQASPHIELAISVH